MSELGEIIKRARIAKGWSQEGLERSIGACGGAVSRWERGQNVPRVSYLVALSKELNLHPLLLKRLMFLAVRDSYASDKRSRLSPKLEHFRQSAELGDIPVWILQHRQWCILQLHDQQGRSFKKIGALFSLSPQRVHQLYQHAKRTINLWRELR